MRHRILLLLSAAALLPATAFADCTATFQKGGNPLTGLRYSASSSLPSLSPESAIGQLRAIVLGKNYQILSEEPESGTMVFEQPMSGKARAIQLAATASDEGGAGTVKIEARLPRGMLAQEEMARTEICAILAQLKGGSAGEAAAAKGKTAQGKAPAPLRMSAFALSNLILNDSDKNPAAILPRYRGRVFTVFGTIDSIYPGSQGDTTIYFKQTDPMALPVQLPGQQRDKGRVLCRLAKGQSSFAMTRKINDKITLTGTFDDFDNADNTISLKDCVPGK